jgi:hypothetical protein
MLHKYVNFIKNPISVWFHNGEECMWKLCTPIRVASFHSYVYVVSSD